MPQYVERNYTFFSSVDDLILILNYYYFYSALIFSMDRENSIMVGCPLVVQWVIGSIPHGGSTDYFSFQAGLHNWFNKGHDMCYLVCRMVHIKDLLLLIKKSSL